MNKLPMFKDFLCNNIVCNIFENYNIFEKSLYLNDSFFVPIPLNLSNLKPLTEIDSNDNIIEENIKKQKNNYNVVKKLESSPDEETVLNNDFCFSIKFDASFLTPGISLQQILKISNTLHTDLIFISGDGNDYELGEYTSGHDAEIILNIHFLENKEELINDYKTWAKNKEIYLTDKKTGYKNRNRIYC